MLRNRGFSGKRDKLDPKIFWRVETFQAYHSMSVPMECGHSAGTMSEAGELWRTKEILSGKHTVVLSVQPYPLPQSQTSLPVHRFNCEFLVNLRFKDYEFQNVVANGYSCIFKALLWCHICWIGRSHQASSSDDILIPDWDRHVVPLHSLWFQVDRAAVVTFLNLKMSINKVSCSEVITKRETWRDRHICSLS